MEPTQKFVPTLFLTLRKVKYGDSIYLTGSHPLIGGWSFLNSIELHYGHYDIWSAIVLLPIGETVEYKFLQSRSFKSEPERIMWDAGSNQKLAVEDAKPDSDYLNIMSFNIRYENDLDGENSWTLRRQLVTSVILDSMPDILGTQESRPSQTQFLKESLSKYYDCYSRGRDFNDNDEAMSIYYNHARFVLMDKGTFWLSDSRFEPGSRVRGADFPRICSWVKLFDNYKKRVLLFFNTHFEHKTKEIRKRNSEILLDEIKNVSGKGENVILTGDFNANEGETCIEMIKKKLSDSCEKSEYTFHNFWGFNCMIGKIDFIFFGKEFQRVDFMNIKTSEQRNGSTRYPSDHYPIKALLKYVQQ